MKRKKFLIGLTAVVSLVGLTWFAFALADAFKVRCRQYTSQEFRLIEQFANVRDLPIVGPICVCERWAPRRPIVAAGELNVSEFQPWLSQHPGFHYVEFMHDLEDEGSWHPMVQTCLPSVGLPAQFATSGDYVMSWVNNASGWQYQLRINRQRRTFELHCMPEETP
jgi:hypothetical protein